MRVDTAELADWIGYSRYKAALEKAATAKAEAEREMARRQREAPPPVLVSGKRNKRREQ